MSWLCAIAINCCRDIRRRRWLRNESGRSLEELPEIGKEFKAHDDTLINEVMNLRGNTVKLSCCTTTRESACVKLRKRS